MTEKRAEMILPKTSRERMSIFILTCMLFFTFSGPTAANSEANNPMDIVLLNEKGEKVRLGQMAASEPLLLYFWATWCQPCRKTQPKVSAFAEKYEGRVKVVGINVGGVDSLEDVRKYRSRYKINYPQLLDRYDEAVKSYSIYVIPTIILLDRTGEVRHRGNKLPENLEELLPK